MHAKRLAGTCSEEGASDFSRRSFLRRSCVAAMGVTLSLLNGCKGDSPAPVSADHVAPPESETPIPGSYLRLQDGSSLELELGDILVLEA